MRETHFAGVKLAGGETEAILKTSHLALSNTGRSPARDVPEHLNENITVLFVP